MLLFKGSKPLIPPLAVNAIIRAYLYTIVVALA